VTQQTWPSGGWTPPEGTSHDPVPASDVVRHLHHVTDIIVPLANGEPVTVLDALEAAAPLPRPLWIHQMHALHDRRYLHGEILGLRHVSYFLSHVTRPLFHAGTVDLVPNHFSEVPQMIREMSGLPLVVASVSPPDEDGFFSLGTNCDYVAPLAGQVPFFVEANARMPRTYGANQVHLSQVVGWCEADYPLVEVPPAEPGPIDEAIAGAVAERVPDGATIQAGIGAIPNAILTHLRDRRHLGVHTELLSDGFVDLIESGAVDGSRKALLPGKAVTTFALGTQRLYDFLDGNRDVELHPVDWVNDPRVIAQMDRFVSINATTEVDLYGQCASETVAGRYWSSSGGQADFARGAMYAREGQGFIVLPSTTRDGKISRIRSQLTTGSVVTTLKNTVDHVVTEYGIAKLRGRSLAQRAEALIGIAHPRFREELRADAKALGLL
jgi:acyl-CoA hydrolase